MEPQSAAGLNPGLILGNASFQLVETNENRFKLRFLCNKPFTSITLGYLVADMPGDNSSPGNIGGALAAALGGRELAVS